MGSYIEPEVYSTLPPETITWLTRSNCLEVSDEWSLKSPAAVRYGGLRYSSPHSPGMSFNPIWAYLIFWWSCSVSFILKACKLESVYFVDEELSLEPKMTALTAGISSEYRIAMAAMDTECWIAIWLTVCRMIWKLVHPPKPWSIPSISTRS